MTGRSPTDALASYDSFRRAALAERAAYARGGDLAPLVRLLGSTPTPDLNVPVRVRYLLTGWTRPPVRPAARHTESLSPGFSVRRRLLPRTELGRRGRFLRYGFRLEAVTRDLVTLPSLGLGAIEAASDGLPVLHPVFTDARGRARALHSSNEPAARKLARLGYAPAEGGAPVGYIDDVVAAIVPDDAHPGLWPLVLATERPEVVYPIVEADPSRPSHSLLADVLGLFEVHSRWADRYRLAVSGLAGPFRSDLVPLAVDRVRPHIAAPGEAVALPEYPTPVETRVRYRAGHRPLPAPDGRWLRLDDVRVQDGGTVDDGGRLVLYEAAADPALDFVAGTWESSFGSAAHPEGMLLRRRPDAAETIEEGILLSGRADDNWYHFIAEYLPRVLDIPAEVGPDVPLLVSRRTIPAGLDALRTLTDRPIVMLDADRSTAVRRLHVAAPVVQILDSTRIPWSEGLAVDLRRLRALRAAWGVDAPRKGRGRRIFLRRRSRHRLLLNEAELVALATRRGLEVVDPTGLGFAAQRALYESTELLVSASGAVMANYLMMRPGSQIIAFTSHHLRDFIEPPAIAAAAGCSFEYVTGPAAVSGDDVADANQWMHADFRVDAASFGAALADAIRALDAAV